MRYGGKLRAGRIALSGVAVLAALLTSACAGLGQSANTPLPEATPIVYTYFTDGQAGLRAGLRAVSGRDGSQLWQASIEHVNWSPILVGDTLIACTNGPQHPGENIVAVRLSDGKVLWRTPLPGDTFNDVPAADTTTVVVDGGEQGLYALDVATGSVRWHRAGLAAGQAALANGLVYARYNPHPTVGPSSPTELTALSEADGTTLWHVAYDSVDRIALSGSTVFANDGLGSVAALGPQDGKLQWANSATGRVIAAYDDMVLADSTSLDALDPHDGHLLWRSTVDFGPSTFAYQDLPRAGGLIYGATDDGVTDRGVTKNAVVAVRASDGTVAWRDNTGSMSAVGVLVQGNVVFALLTPPQNEFNIGPCLSNCTTRLAAINAATGAIYWQEDVGDAQELPVRAH